MNELRKKAEELKESLVQWRRYIHKHPELGFEEEKTSQFIQERLKEMNIPFNIVAKTGIVALIKGESDGPTLALRADIDALPIKDEKETSYASKVQGKGHLCGHDAHITMLLCAAKLLSEHKVKKGNIKLLFQPAEETGKGAKKLIEYGVLQNPKVDAIVGLHVNPMVETGHVTCSKKEVCAASDFFNIEIKGSGGHAAHPHLSKDPIPMAANVISSLQQIVSRQIDPLTPTVLTIGQIHGGYADNAIASSVSLGGTVRTLDEEVRASIKEKMENVISGVTSSLGGEYKFHYHYETPVLTNDDSLIPTLEETVKTILGEHSFSIVNPSMGGEDFAFYTREVPGLFFRLGVRNENKGIVYPLHHPLFDLDEEALPYGGALLAQYALNYLK
ncbi:M20 metallopeptidase family protein [Priestia endophytica]